MDSVFMQRLKESLYHNNWLCSFASAAEAIEFTVKARSLFCFTVNGLQSGK